MWFLYAIILTLILIFIITDYIENRNLYRKVKKFNGPKAFPILGNILCFLSFKNIMNFKTEGKLIDFYKKLLMI